MYESNRVLAPLYGMRVGSSLGGLIPAGDGLLTITGAVAGHAVGANMTRRQEASIAGGNKTKTVQPVSFSVAD